MPGTLLLDLDDTILDDTGGRDRCWEIACDEAAARHGLDRDELFARIGEARDWLWGDAERHREWRQKMQEAWREVARVALRGLGIVDEALARELGDRNYELRDEIRAVLPGALETLEELRRRGVTLGLVTNGAGEAQRAKLVRFALGGHFAYVGIEGEVGHGKPHRRAFEAALDALGARPDGAWMVGDNLEWDVAGAQAVGIRGIWLDRFETGLPEGSPVVPDAIVRSLGELL